MSQPNVPRLLASTSTFVDSSSSAVDPLPSPAHAVVDALSNDTAIPSEQKLHRLPSWERIPNIVAVASNPNSALSTGRELAFQVSSGAEARPGSLSSHHHKTHVKHRARNRLGKFNREFIGDASIIQPVVVRRQDHRKEFPAAPHLTRVDAVASAQVTARDYDQVTASKENTVSEFQRRTRGRIRERHQKKTKEQMLRDEYQRRMVQKVLDTNQQHAQYQFDASQRIERKLHSDALSQLPIRSRLRKQAAKILQAQSEAREWLGSLSESAENAGAAAAAAAATAGAATMAASKTSKTSTANKQPGSSSVPDEAMWDRELPDQYHLNAEQRIRLQLALKRSEMRHERRFARAKAESSAGSTQ
jgi:hypothetical protein